MPEKLSHGLRANSDLNRCAGLSRGPNLQKKLTAAAWSNTFPAPQATLDLDFANNRGFVRGVGQGGSMDAVTFTRASVGKYIDGTGTLVDAANNAPRFDWASTAQTANVNLLTYTEQFDNAAWTKTASSITANTIVAPDGTLTADKIIPNTLSTNSDGVYQNNSTNAVLTFSIYAKAGEYSCLALTNNPNGRIYFDLTNGTVSALTAGWGSASATDAGNGWWRCSVTTSATQNGINWFAYAFPDYASRLNNFSGDGYSGIYIWGAQLELGTTATTYQPIAQPTTNTPLAATSACNGLLIEESRANRLLWCRDATQTNWTKSNVTAAKDQTGIDGVANAASSLTASADGGTCVQTITLASGSRTGSVYLKRIYGTGTIQVSLDGSTWSTVDLSNGLWNRIVLSGTVTNPTVGIKIATNGDAVAMDYGQVEDGGFATSPILTTTASVTRSADSASMTGSNFSGWYRADEGTVYAEASYIAISANDKYVFNMYDSTASNSMQIYASSNGRTRFYVAVNSAVVVDLPSPVSTVQAGAFLKQVGAYALNNSIFSYNGSLTSTDTACPVPVVDRIAIGGTMNGTIKRIAYYPKRLNNNVLQILTGGAT